jgi:hypothetical protein
MLPAIRQRGDMSRGDTPAHQSMNSRESSHCAVESGHKSRRTSARSTGSPKIPVLKAGARRRSSRDRMTWLLPQELKESNHRLCKKKDHEGKFGSSTRFVRVTPCTSFRASIHNPPLPLPLPPLPPPATISLLRAYLLWW